MLQNETLPIPQLTPDPLPMLGKYQLIREIARSNDIVYEGVDTVSEQRVALKELNLPPSLSEAARKVRIDRFYREARAASAMNHPNIVTILEVGEENGRHFIAMEFLEGGTLRQRLTEKGSLSEAEAAAIGIALCDALAYAHERGVIHRDIKPDNVFAAEIPNQEDDTLPPTLRVKLTDFGIARITHEETMTATGQFFGTPSYMSPEQLSGLAGVDARSDIFSLGIMLWEMVIGRKPFAGDSVPNTMFRVLNDPTPSTNGHAPALEPVIHKATAKNPAARYLSAGEMRAALVTALENSANGRVSVALAAETLTKPTTMEKGYVLSVELVDFDQIAKPLRERLVGGLQSVALATDEAKKAKADKRLLCRTAPGGLLIAFFNGDPLSPIRCAAELEKSFRLTSAPLAQQLTTPLNLRMGIASGGVVYSDNFQEETTGEGVTVTQRIARMGGGAHGGNILVSANVAADGMKSPVWSERLFDLGFCDAGDGMRIHLYNLHGFGYGNVALPPGLSPKASSLPVSNAPLEPIQAAPLPLSRGARTALIAASLLALLGVVGWRNQASLEKMAASAQKTYQAWQSPKPSKPRSAPPVKTQPGTATHQTRRGGRSATAPSSPSNGGVDERVRVPRLTGISQDAALSFVEAAGLTVSDADTVYSSRVPEGIVFRQVPAAGTRVFPGTAVHLSVSLGPDPDTAAGPDPIVEPADDAASPDPEATVLPDVVETPAED
jgi:tRNA A-37 threonylcarbamoyl transferase component Bud32